MKSSEMPYNPDYPFKPFIFIGERIDTEFAVPREIIKNSYLKFADQAQIEAIKQLIAPHELLAASNKSLPNIYEIDIQIVKDKNGRNRSSFKDLQPKDYQYWIVEHADLLFKENLSLAIELGPKKLTVIGEIGQIGATAIPPIKSKIFYSDYRLIHTEKQILSDGDVNEINEIYNILGQFNSTEYKNSIIGKVLSDYHKIKDISDNSSFKIIGYFSMLESLLAHNPKNNDSSINRQLQKKISLINNQLGKKIDFKSTFGGPDTLTDEKIIEKLYSYRSKISHGDYSDFNNDLQVLGNHERTCSFLESLTKTVIKFSLKYPQLILDLKEC